MWNEVSVAIREGLTEKGTFELALNNKVGVLGVEACDARGVMRAEV